MLRFCCLMKVRRERERSLAHTFAFLCVRAREITHIHTHRTRGYNDGRRGGCAAAEEEGSELIVFLRINIINVIQQSVLDEGAITPGKIHSTSLIGAAIDRPRGSRSAEQCIRFRLCMYATSDSREPKEFLLEGFRQEAGGGWFREMEILFGERRIESKGSRFHVLHSFDERDNRKYICRSQ